MIFSMITPDRSNGSARTMGARLRQAREAAKLTQEKVSQALGFNDRQTLSEIEGGARRVRPDELVRFSELFDRPIEWFVDPFVVADEARFSWRVASTVPGTTLNSFEDRTGTWVGLLRFLRRCQGGAPQPFGKQLWLGERPTFEDAAEKGEAVAAKLDLGLIPADQLIEQIEAKLDIPVLFVDGPPADGISGAMCRLADLGVILINRHESLVRRHFDVAHELFHALTWDAYPPQHRESRELSRGGSRVERLADNFAAALLIPGKSLEQLLERDRLDDLDYLATLARRLQVSTLTLGYRLVNLGLIDKAHCAALSKVKLPRIHTPPTPKRLSAYFVKLLHAGIQGGHVSERKAAKALGMTLEELAGLFVEYNQVEYNQSVQLAH